MDTTTMDPQRDTAQQELYAIAQQVALPDFVKTAVHASQQDMSVLKDAQFADQAHRRWPIDSPANVFMSATYLARNADRLPFDAKYAKHVADRIKTAARVCGILDTVQEAVLDLTPQLVDTPEKLASYCQRSKTGAAVLEVFNVSEKLAMRMRAVQGRFKSAEDFNDVHCWVGPDAEGIPTGCYPARNELEVYKVAHEYAKNRHDYSPELRRSISTRILEKVAQFGAEHVRIPLDVFADARAAVPNNKSAAAQLRLRADLVHEQKLAGSFRALADLVEATPNAELAELAGKVAQYIEFVDTKYKLTELHGGHLKTASDSAWIHPAVAQNVVDDTVKLAGYPILISRLAEMDPDVTLRPVLGDKLADYVIENTVTVLGRRRVAKHAQEYMRQELVKLPEEHQRGLLDHFRYTER